MLQRIFRYLENSSVVDKLIMLCVIVFLIAIWLPMSITTRFFVYSDSLSCLKTQPWAVTTFLFIHVRFIHLLFNIVILFYVGHIFLDFFSKKRFIFNLVLSAFSGGLTYMLYYFLFPSEQVVYLNGLEFFIMGLFVLVIIKVPYYELKLRFVGGIKIWVIFVVWLSCYSVFNLVLDEGVIISSLFVMAVVIVGNYLLDNNTKPKPHLKVVHSTKTQLNNTVKFVAEYEVNRILDKINAKGISSLSREEKDFLNKQSQNNASR